MLLRLVLIAVASVAAFGVVSCSSRILPVDHGVCAIVAGEEMKGQPYVNVVYTCSGQFVRMILPRGNK